MRYIIRLRTYENSPASLTDGQRDAMIQATSEEEAIAWASRCALADGEVLEFRQVYELSDFGTLAAI